MYPDLFVGPEASRILLCNNLLFCGCSLVEVFPCDNFINFAVVYNYLSQGAQHLVKIVCCSYSVSESFLLQGLWPATSMSPTLAFATKQTEFILPLLREFQVSIFDLVKALTFTGNPLIKVYVFLLIITAATGSENTHFFHLSVTFISFHIFKKCILCF